MEKQTGAHLEHSLPEAAIEQAERGSFYYKTLERSEPNSDILRERLGIRVVEF